MNYKGRLRSFLKSEGISQRELGERLGHAPAMISRYLNGVSTPDADFIQKLVEEFPKVDLKYIFSNTQADPVRVVNEIQEVYSNEILADILVIEQKLEHIRKVMEQNCHTKK